jgi:hypothetical protein
MNAEQMLQKACHKSMMFLKRNSSTILTSVGAIGVVATAVMAAKATPKALELVKEATDEKGEELTKMEVFQVAAPAYIPSVVVGASTIACIFGANVLNHRHQASLASAYALVDSAYKDYRNKVKELYGSETDRNIRAAIAKDKCTELGAYAPGYDSLDISGEQRLFYEEYRGKYFETTIENVQNAEYHLNRNFAMRGDTNLNEFYSFLGLEPTEEGYVLGWDCCKLAEEYDTYWIDFNHETVTLDDGLECCIIHFPTPPVADYDHY